jgi:K+-sensing histidine kinase KdpD
LEGIQASSERLTRLVEDFISMAEFKTGEAESAFRMRAAPVHNMSMVLYEAAYQLQFDAEQEGVEFRYNLDHELPAVLCDRDRLLVSLERLLNLLLANLEQRKGVVMQLSSTADEERVYLDIQALKSPFPLPDAKRIAQFFASDDETVLELRSFGPALTVIKNVIQLHQGTIAMKQPSQDELQVTLSFPIYETHAVSISSR